MPISGIILHRIVGLPDGEKNFEDIYNRLDSIPTCDGQTDRRTDILPRHSPRYAYASRGNFFSSSDSASAFLTHQTIELLQRESPMFIPPEFWVPNIAFILIELTIEYRS